MGHTTEVELQPLVRKDLCEHPVQLISSLKMNYLFKLADLCVLNHL